VGIFDLILASKKPDARANAQRLSRSAAVACSDARANAQRLSR
jgi:hypothetical protein